MLYAQQDQLQRALEYLQKRSNCVRTTRGIEQSWRSIRPRSGLLQGGGTFKTGIRVAPDYDQSYLNLARLYAMQNNKDKAKAVLLELLRIRPQDEGARRYWISAMTASMRTSIDAEDTRPCRASSYDRNRQNMVEGRRHSLTVAMLLVFRHARSSSNPQDVRQIPQVEEMMQQAILMSQDRNAEGTPAESFQR